MVIKDRINEFRQSKCLSIKAFEREIGVSNGSWKKTESLSEDVLLKTIERFPEIDAVWLLRGENYLSEDASNNENSNELIEKLKEENDNLKREIQRLISMKLPTKDSKIYNLWMKFMEITEEMQELYKEEKGE